MTNHTSDLSSELSPYIYGTTRLGDDSIDLEARINITSIAMKSGVWFHTSHQYNSALNILNRAFKREPENVPRLIVKLGGDNLSMFRADIEKNLEPLGLDRINVGQLCLGGELASDFAQGGSTLRELEKIQDEGLVDRYVMEVFPWTSHIAYEALKNGATENLVDAFIFYLNPLQRFASNKLWDLLQEKEQKIVAMRTVAGGPVHMLRDVPGFAWKKYLQERASQVAPIFERSGEANWTNFCVRFAHSLPNVLATVGATAKPKNLSEFLSAKDNITPLPTDVVEDIQNLHYRWSNETDMNAEPWTM